MSEIVNKVVPLVQLRPHPRNFRNHPESQIQQLAASYRRFGQFRSVVAIEEMPQDYLIVAGHGFVEAMRREGVESVHVDLLPPGTDSTTLEGIMLADNLHAQNAQDDSELLVHLLQEQQNVGFDLASLGSDDESLRQMLESLGDEYLAGDESDTEEAEAPEVEEEQTRVKPGDIWQLGNHRIACLNSCDAEQVKKLLDGKAIQFVFSDPPYGIEIVATNVSVGGGEAYDIPFGGVKKARGDVGGSASHIRKTGMSYLEASQKGLRGSDGASKPFGSKNVRGTVGATNVVEAGKYFPVIGDDSTATAISSYRLCAELFPKAVQVWWGANYYANALPPSSCWIVWDKENTGNFADVELAWCSEKKAARLFRHMWNGMLKASEHGVRRVHPTQKPVKLAEFVFSEFGHEDDVIYDPFLGSGISVIAAENLGRSVIGCELSPEYINVILTRWEKHSGQTAQLLERVEVPVYA